MVSFTGKFDIDVLREVGKGRASETGEGNREPTKDLTLKAQQARDRLRYAEGLRRCQQAGQSKFSARDLSELALLANGSLRTEANDATRKSGFGRIKHENGTYEDIARHGGGIVRTLLDHMTPHIFDDKQLWTLD